MGCITPGGIQSAISCVTSATVCANALCALSKFLARTCFKSIGYLLNPQLRHTSQSGETALYTCAPLSVARCSRSCFNASRTKPATSTLPKTRCSPRPTFVCQRAQILARLAAAKLERVEQRQNIGGAKFRFPRVLRGVPIFPKRIFFALHLREAILPHIHFTTPQMSQCRARGPFAICCRVHP